MKLSSASRRDGPVFDDEGADDVTLRARMIEDMKLAGLAATTQEIYLQAVRSLAKHYNRSPERGRGPAISAGCS